MGVLLGSGTAISMLWEVLLALFFITLFKRPQSIYIYECAILFQSVSPQLCGKHKAVHLGRVGWGGYGLYALK